MINTVVKMTKVCLLNMMFFKIVESATPDLYVMEWSLDCPFCWVHHLAHTNGLAWCLTQCKRLAWRGMTIPSYITHFEKGQGFCPTRNPSQEEQSPLKLPYSVVILDTISEPLVGRANKLSFGHSMMLQQQADTNSI